MSRSLSALMPFYNAQHSVLRIIPAYIDGLSDLTPDWEMAMVDDGSSDATPEILCDIAQAYPQIRLALHAQPKGTYLAYCTALAISRGEFLFLPLHYRPVSLDGLHRLWKESGHEPLVVGTCLSHPESIPSIDCLLIHRSVASPILPALSSPERLRQVLARFEPHVVAVSLGTESSGRIFDSSGMRAITERQTAADGPESLPPPKSVLPRPASTIFTRLKQFTLGE